MTTMPSEQTSADYATYDDDHRKRWVIYATAAVVVLILLVVMIIAYRGHKATQQALLKADTLNAALARAGLPTADRDQVARTLGTDGGAVCTTSHSDLGKAALKLGLVNGAAGPGIRPVTVAREVIQGERLILQTYCPQNLSTFDKLIHDLKFAGVIKN